MTKQGPTETRRCKWCGGSFEVARGPGRPAEYCRRSHRQRHHEAVKHGATRGLEPGEILIAADDWQRLQDGLYILETAVEDVDRHRGANPTRAALSEALDHLRAAAQEALESSPDPKAVQ